MTLHYDHPTSTVRDANGKVVANVLITARYYGGGPTATLHSADYTLKLGQLQGEGPINAEVVSNWAVRETEAWLQRVGRA